MKLAVLLLLSSCRDGGDSPAQQPSVRLSPHEPGSIASPSNANSVELFSMDGAKRLVLFQGMIINSAQKCAQTTGAVLKGGAGGMDVWRVTCSDSGDWAVSIDSDSAPTVLPCADLPGNECHVVWSKP